LKSRSSLNYFSNSNAPLRAEKRNIDSLNCFAKNEYSVGADKK
jgi:hypothetical protein